MQAGPVPGLERAGLLIACAGAVVAAVGNFAEDALGVSALGDAMYLPGVLLLSVGLLLLGVALLRAPPPWRLLAAGPLATFLCLFILGDAAGLVLGPVWIGLAALAQSGRPASAA